MVIKVMGVYSMLNQLVILVIANSAEGPDILQFSDISYNSGSII